MIVVVSVLEDVLLVVTDRENDPRGRYVTKGGRYAGSFAAGDECVLLHDGEVVLSPREAMACRFVLRNALGFLSVARGAAEAGANLVDHELRKPN